MDLTFTNPNSTRLLPTRGATLHRTRYSVCGGYLSNSSTPPWVRCTWRTGTSARSLTAILFRPTAACISGAGSSYVYQSSSARTAMKEPLSGRRVSTTRQTSRPLSPASQHRFKPRSCRPTPMTSPSTWSPVSASSAPARHMGHSSAGAPRTGATPSS